MVSLVSDMQAKEHTEARRGHLVPRKYSTLECISTLKFHSRMHFHSEIPLCYPVADPVQGTRGTCPPFLTSSNKTSSLSVCGLEQQSIIAACRTADHLYSCRLLKLKSKMIPSISAISCYYNVCHTVINQSMIRKARHNYDNVHHAMMALSFLYVK